MSDSEKEYDYTAYACENYFIVKILVAGGGLMNGNAYREIEAHYTTKEDWENSDSAVNIYLCEYGSYPKRELLSEKNIIWGECDSFNLE